MTLPSERTRAIIQTQKFLAQLSNPKVIPSVPKTVRETAKALLRHYPERHDLETLVSGWGDAFIAFAVECPIKLEDK